MEVRDFIQEEVTVFKENGLTPAAETLVNEEFLMEDEAILAAYKNKCEDLDDEIEILFDDSSSYSLIDPDDDTYEELCRKLDEVPEEVWRADDVLGWVYEYYNRPIVEELDAKNTLEPDDVGPANQFYTPHWVVRMLADNSLGKLYLEATGREDSIPELSAFSPEERKDRPVTPEEAPDVAELCTYLIPDDEEQDAPSFDHPRELRVIDPACGSGHFLLYAFDILERIWWAETDYGRGEIPAKILEHNLYGVDIDLRSCQLSAFNLYLKARMRAEQEANNEFEMPNVGIVCADARVAEVQEAVDVLNDISGEGTDARKAIEEIIEEFQTTEALGSLLDVQSKLSEEFMQEQTDVMEWGEEGPNTLNAFLKQLREAVKRETADSFGEQNLRSFLNLLVVLTQDYDIALMNPPYGSQGRIPSGVRDYLENHYKYTAEFYINFFEVCESIVKENGRIGMIVPRTFMFKKSLEEFREDFIGKLGSFDFMSEYGNDVLDNATVRTAGTVVRSGTDIDSDPTATFFRLTDVEKEHKEEVFLETAFGRSDGTVERQYNRSLEEFSLISGSPLSYWISKDIRSLFQSETVFDAENGGVDAESAGSVKAGLTTGNNGRFTRRFWETLNQSFVPYAKGGKDAWLLPRIDRKVLWGKSGKEIKRYDGSYPRNEEYYFEEVITYTYIKEGGRRFGYLNSGSLFDHTGKIFAPEADTWSILGYANTDLFTYFMLGQTPDRNWEVSQVAKVPYPNEIETETQVPIASKKAVGNLIGVRQYDINSPYYVGPALIAALGKNDPLDCHEQHGHRKLRENVDVPSFSKILDTSYSINGIGKQVVSHLNQIQSELYQSSDKINSEVMEYYDIPEYKQDEITTEIALRTNEDPQETPDTIQFNEERLQELVKDTLHHICIKIVRGSDGIVPLSRVEGENNLLTLIKDEFEELFGQYARPRLAEVDQVLGIRTADEVAYPNLRAWIEGCLFDYHVSAFNRTPILWRVTTQKLVSDSDSEGFACLIDYHQLDSNVFDRLQNRYLEPRKALLRERRSAANRRRGDDSLSAAEQAEAAEEYARCESGLEQVDRFEERMSELAQPTPREWPQGQQDMARRATELVRDFREQTASRLSTVDALAQLDDADMESLFASSFEQKVEENKQEWLSALEDLEAAFNAYAKDGSEPVEAHLYDLFEYYDSVKGTKHFASNGILYMTYYFDKFEETDQASLGDEGNPERQRLLSELASGLEEYLNLAEKINNICEEIAAVVSSDWKDRALSEITTEGYAPNHKHGVEINITPLAEAEIVPKTVEDDVL
jgi:type I restriction-modification system DNA methylase subunit